MADGGISIVKYLKLAGFCLLGFAAAFAHAAPAPAKKIVVLGDSLTAGYGVEKDEAFPALIAKKFASQGAAVEVIASGISGSTSASGPGRMQWLLKSKPDLLLLELGANDGLRGQSLVATKSNLKKTIALAKSNGIKVVLAGMKVPPNYGADYAGKFAKIFDELAKEEQVILIPFFFEDLMKSTKKSLLLADGLHPNTEGHRLIADKLFAFLQPLL